MLWENSASTQHNDNIQNARNDLRSKNNGFAAAKYCLELTEYLV